MAPAIIAVVGGLNMDLIFTVNRMLNVGESIDAPSLFVHPGGKGANIAIATSRGCRPKPIPKEREEESGVASIDFSGGNNIQVFMNGAVGDDGYGETLKAGLVQNGVDISGLVTVKGESSGVCVVFVEAYRLPGH